MDKNTVKIAIKVKAEMYYKDAISHYKLANPRDLNISFDLRGAKAGTATPLYNKVTYNLDMAVENFDEFMSMTVGHEVAHLIAHKLVRNCKPHGYEWKMVMKYFNCDDSRCHSMTYKNAATRRRYMYTCKCGHIYKVGVKIHNNIQNNIKYSCTRCKRILSPLSLTR